MTVPTPSTGSSPRRQQERASATRLLLLDATFDCLVSLGYGRTSTPEVLRRTGVSRGALLHHFPTKTDLVCAAVDHVFQRQIQEFGEALAARDPGTVTQGAAVELLWESISGDSFYAWLELSVAARTDEALLSKVQEVDRRFEEAAGALHGLLIPDSPTSKGHLANHRRRFIFATLIGLSVQSIYRDSGASRAVVEPLKSLAPRLDDFFES